MTKAEFIQVGGGRVSLSRLIKVGCKFNELRAVVEFYSVETTFIF